MTVRSRSDSLLGAFKSRKTNWTFIVFSHWAPNRVPFPSAIPRIYYYFPIQMQGPHKLDFGAEFTKSSWKLRVNVKLYIYCKMLTLGINGWICWKSPFRVPGHLKSINLALLFLVQINAPRKGTKKYPNTNFCENGVVLVKYQWNHTKSWFAWNNLK